jgi:hypothetical protein
VGARGGEYFISKPWWSSGKIAPGCPSSGLKGSILYLEIVDFFIFVEHRSCDGRGGAQRPVWRVNEPKKTGARSARAHTCGQNPLVPIYAALYAPSLHISASCFPNQRK